MSAPRRTTARREPTITKPQRPAPVAPVPPPAERAPAPRANRAEPKRQSVLQDWLAALQRVIYDTRSELKKITWPDRETTRNLTIVVIGISVALGLLLGGIDYVLFQIFDRLP